MTDRIITLEGPGGVDKFRVDCQTLAAPLDHEIRIRHQAIGTNFLDIYHRKGIYTLPSYPAVIGAEAAGIVDAVGRDVTDIKPGDRVAYAGPLVGAYATTRTIPAEKVVILPSDIPATVAASSLLKGMTAFMMLECICSVKEGDTVLIHAAAGGFGGLLVRWARSLGATVIGTASSAAKAAVAVSHGAKHVIVGRDADLVAEVRAYTHGKGVNIAFDGIGADMLVKSIRATRPFGTVLTIGQVAGPIPPIAVEELRPGKTLCHPSIMAWCGDHERFKTAAQAAIRAMQAGLISRISATLDLGQVAQAHQMMELGESSGSILLIP